MSNEQVAREWLDLDPTAEAAVFFDADDNLMVRTRHDEPEYLNSSRYRDQLSRCLVYLDEVHTRGTDLKLPISSGAAVTLGPRLIKDRLVQGKS